MEQIDGSSLIIFYYWAQVDQRQSLRKHTVSEAKVYGVKGISTQVERNQE